MPAERKRALAGGAGELQKGRGVLCATAAVKYAWRQQQPIAFTVSRMCQLLEVSRSGSDEGRSRPPRAQVKAAQQVEAKVQRYVAQGRGPYGTRRLKDL
jgi:hypothetical protein